MATDISKWKYIFLDTSVIIDLFQSPSFFSKEKVGEKHYKRVSRTQELFTIFKRLAKNKKFVFYLSTISIAELHRDVGEDLEIALLRLLAPSQVTYKDFDADIAFNIIRNRQKYLTDTSYGQLVNHISKNIKNKKTVFNARNWVLDDLKIASTAKALPDKKLDIVLSSDQKTFIPICQKLNIPCFNTHDIPTDMYGDVDINKLCPIS